MSYTKTYALKGNQPPGWMHIAPIEPLTHEQWKAAESVIILSEINGPVSVRVIAQNANVSHGVVRRALRKLTDMGLIRQVQGYGTPHYARKFYTR